MLIRLSTTLLLLVLHAGLGSAALGKDRHKPKPQYAETAPPIYPGVNAYSAPNTPGSHYAHSGPNAYTAGDGNPSILRPAFKVNPEQAFSWISSARCGISTYSEERILKAAKMGCAQSPFNYAAFGFRRATQYFPENPNQYMSSGPFFIYPIGKPILNTRTAQYYGWDRIVLNIWCQVVGVVTERPKVTEFLSKTHRFVRGRPQKEHLQQNYHYSDCAISMKPPV